MPTINEKLNEKLNRVRRPARPALDKVSVGEFAPEGVIGNSQTMLDVYRNLNQAAKVDTPVLLLGESGTGKALLAYKLHQMSPRRDYPLVTLNCSALSEEQLERELFGQAVATGCFEHCREGTLFLDEVHALSLRMQARLVGVLQAGCFQRSGESASIRINVRLIAASDQDLNRLVVERQFREDLFWKMSVLPIVIPPLRRRDGDIERLANHFLAHFAALHQRPIDRIESSAMKALASYPWPGNVRELQNYLERAVVQTQTNQVEINSLPNTVVGDSKAAQAAVFRPTDEQSLIREFVYNRLSKSESDAEDLHKQIVEPVERELLTQIMESCQQTQTKAASRLGINRNTLYKKLVEYGLAKSPAGEREAE